MDKTPVDVLNISSPQKISVRPRSWKENHYKFQRALDLFCCESQAKGELKSLAPGLAGLQCVVRLTSSWQRGKVLCIDQAVIRVRLVDYGQDQDSDGRNLYQLPERFSTETQEAFSEFVHLAGVSEDITNNDEVVKAMEEVLSEVASPFYIGLSKVKSPDYGSRDEPHWLSDRWSIPVELCWLEQRVEHATGPVIERTAFLSQRVRGLLKDQPELLPPEEDDNEDEDDEDKDDVDNVSDEGVSSVDDAECTPWLDAETPTERKFYGRGTHVDEAGQIYMHLHSKRSEFNNLSAELRRLQRHCDFDDSLLGDGDSSMVSLKEHQAVVAPHSDGALHRATFLKYHRSSRALVKYVDWGSLGLVETDQLRSRRDLKAWDRPSFAFRVVLGNVLPSGGSEWSNEAVDFIYQNILYCNFRAPAQHNKIKVKLLQAGQREEPLLVSISLFTPLQEENQFYSPWQDLADILIKRGEAVAATPSQVNSREQRERREMFQFSRSAGLQEEFSLLRISPRPRSESEQKLARLSVQLNGGDCVEVRLVSQLSWNIVTVHLISDWTNSLNLNIFKLLETSELAPVRDPRPGMLVAFSKQEFGWVRGMVANVRQDGSVLLKLVDLETLELVTVSQLSGLRQLSEELCLLPSPAIIVKLAVASADRQLKEVELQALIEDSLTCTEGKTFLKVERYLGGSGSPVMLGHLVDSHRVPVYRSLAEESFISIH